VLDDEAARPAALLIDEAHPLALARGVRRGFGSSLPQRELCLDRERVREHPRSRPRPEKLACGGEVLLRRVEVAARRAQGGLEIMRAALRNLARGLREEVRADLVDEGVLEGLAVILGDGLAPAGNSGPVGPFREIVARLQHVLVALLDLASDVQQECAVDGVDDGHAVDDVAGGGDRLPLTRPSGVYGGVAQQVTLGDLDTPMTPPARPIALITCPSMPGRARSRPRAPPASRSVPVVAAMDRASDSIACWPCDSTPCAT
jgi:hypothetical protein